MLLTLGLLTLAWEIPRVLGAVPEDGRVWEEVILYSSPAKAAVSPENLIFVISWRSLSLETGNPSETLLN